MSSGTPSQRPSCPIVLASDEGYAMPLATALRSLADSNRAHWPLDVHVLTDGFSSGARQQVLRSLPEGAMQIRWVPVDLSAFGSFGLLEHVSRISYARLLIAQLFPATVPRVLYLDTDILVMGDLSALWNSDLKGHVIGAVVDHHVDTDLRANRVDRIQGVPRVRRYFNAGVLLMDLRELRRRQSLERAMDYLRTHTETPYSDQDALNVACDGAWAELDSRWNFQNHHHARIARLPAALRPAVLHFITRSKPWKPSSVSVNAGLFESVRDHTQFRRTLSDKLWARVCTEGHRIKHRFERISAAFDGKEASPP